MIKQKNSKLLLPLAAFFALPLLIIGAFVGLSNMNAQAAPGNPGIPEAPTILYDEDFENSPTTIPVQLADYTGSGGMTYTSDVAWRSNCNGEILYFDMADNQFANTNCDGGDGTNTTTAYDAVRRLAYALGSLPGGSSTTTNRALTAYTDNGATFVDPGAGLVQFETVDRVNLASGTRRFILSNIDIAAINCSSAGTVQGKVVLYLLDGSDVRRINQTAINICTNSAATTVTPPPLQSNGAIGPNNGSIRVGSVFTDRALLSGSDSIGIRMINEEGGGLGNDNALDNIQMADASPKLDKIFDPETADVGGASRMTFSVTNTTDLLAKQGWSFTDTLPENLVIADNPNPETDCPNGLITAQAAAKTVQYSGDLSVGMTSCTLSVDVTSDVAGIYVNGPGNLSDVIGLHLPADATVTFAPKTPDSGESSANQRTGLYAGVATLAAGSAFLLKRKFLRR